MAVIYIAENFIVEVPAQPLISRTDGGHIIINPKKRVQKLQDLSTEQANELMLLLRVTGAAMETVMNKNGVDIGRINYQDNGNWGVFLPEGPYQHFHIYGRAKSAVIQKYGQSLYFPHKNDSPEFYYNLQPLNEKDIADMQSEIERLLNIETSQQNFF